MRADDAKHLFTSLAKWYFAHGAVATSRQSRAAKFELPLISITYGNVTRQKSLNEVYVNGEPVGAFQQKMAITVDIFTHGKETKETVDEQEYTTYENSAMDDALSFVDFLDSHHAIAWSQRNDVAISVEGDVMDMTGLVNDSNYEYRARVNLSFYFTQYSVGAAGVLLESSLKTSQDGSMYIDPQFAVTTSGGGNQELADETVGYFIDAIITEENE